MQTSEEEPKEKNRIRESISVAFKNEDSFTKRIKIVYDPIKA